MKPYSMYVSVSVLWVLSLIGCSSDGASNPAVSSYLKSTWGIVVSGFNGELIADKDGTQNYSGTGKITVDGLGSAEITSTTVVSPTAQGGDTTLFVSSLDGSGERYFLYDQVQHYITIGDLTRGVAVSKNPDNTYDVWVFDGSTNKDQDLTVPNGFEALKLVEQQNAFKTISPYILLTAFAFAHAPAPEARCGGYGWFQSTTASQPAVCEIFKEFCDCAACLVLKRQGACAECPNL